MKKQKLFRIEISIYVQSFWAGCENEQKYRQAYIFESASERVAHVSKKERSHERRSYVLLENKNYLINYIYKLI